MESSTSSGGGIQIKNSYLRREVHDPLIPRPGPDHPRALAQGWLTLISAGVILRLVGRCLTVAARESASAMSGLSVGSAATARISSNFSAQTKRCHLSPRAATPTHASIMALTGANEPYPPLGLSLPETWILHSICAPQTLSPSFFPSQTLSLRRPWISLWSLQVTYLYHTH